MVSRVHLNEYAKDLQLLHCHLIFEERGVLQWAQLLFNACKLNGEYMLFSCLSSHSKLR